VIRKLAAACALVSVYMLCLAGAAQVAAAGSRSGLPDVTSLIPRALRHMRATRLCDKAVLYEADGTTANGGGTTSASGVVSWRFIFDNYPSHSRFKSATIAYGPPPKEFGPVRGNPQPFLEDIVIKKAPRMTLAQAVALLRGAGYRTKFFNVTLRDPLGPSPTGPLYIFGFTHRYVDVNVRTKKVSVAG
jgi:hypothetical protein